ncbi:MAG: bacteriocin [Paracoccaceae bacterium]
MRLEHVVAGVIIIVALAACGTNPERRALTGGGLGAAAGAVGTAIVGGPVLAGAAIGAAAGAVVGAVSDPRKINLD